MDRYQEAFNKFEPVENPLVVRDKVKELLDKHSKDNFKENNLKAIHGCLDLTSLGVLDTKDSIWKLVDTVNDFEGSMPDIPNVASVCVYPLFVETVKQALTAQEVKICSVAAGFPSSQTFMEVKIAETSLAVMNGAEEIDIVMNLGYLLEENYQDLTEEIQEIKDCCRDAKLKVILEAGILHDSELLKKAVILAIYSGADFIKTSTGKETAGANPESVYIMCQIIKQYYAITGKRIGIKVAGGVKTAEDAVNYYTIVKEILGEEWLTREFFRIGASQLRQNILEQLQSF